MTNFESLDTVKRDKIINAAFKEFRYGYKKASTDVIVREAGISKGLLFHYFDTKAKFFNYLVGYAVDVLLKDCIEMFDQGQRDILEGVWQLALLKKDVLDRYPYIYDFINGLYAHGDDSPNGEYVPELYTKKSQAMMENIYANCDRGLLRDDIDHKKAIDITFFTASYAFDEGDQNYEAFLERLKGYLDVFRKCFYK